MTEGGISCVHWILTPNILKKRISPYQWHKVGISFQTVVSLGQSDTQDCERRYIQGNFLCNEGKCM